MVIALLTIAAIGVIFLAAFIRLWQSPPKLYINLSGLSIPDRVSLALELKHVPADIETKPIEEPIPEDIIDYISQESELHAQDARKRRVRALRLETGSWEVAYRLLQKEDNPLD
jgi:hypothetical protein